MLLSRCMTYLGEEVGGRFRDVHSRLDGYDHVRLQH